MEERKKEWKKERKKERKKEKNVQTHATPRHNPLSDGTLLVFTFRKGERCEDRTGMRARGMKQGGKSGGGSGRGKRGRGGGGGGKGGGGGGGKGTPATSTGGGKGHKSTRKQISGGRKGASCLSPSNLQGGGKRRSLRDLGAACKVCTLVVVVVVCT